MCYCCEDVLATLAIHSPLPFAAWNADGRPLAVNEAFCRLTGYTRAELLALPQPPGLIPYDERDRLAAILEEHLRSGGPARLETDCLRSDGRRVPVEAWLHSLKGTDGLPRCYYALAHDVSGRQLAVFCREAGDRHRAQECMLKAFFDNPLAMAIMTWPEARYAEVNEAWLRDTGFAREEACGRTPTELGLWAEATTPARIRESLLADGRVRERETRVRRKDGRLLTALLSAGFIEIGGKQHVMAAALDISARKRAEDKAKETLGMLEEVSGAVAGAALAVLDESGVVLRFFGETALFGASPEGKNVRAVLPPPAAADIVGMVAAALADGGPRTREFCAGAGEAARTMTVAATPMARCYRGRRAVSLQVRDVTAERAAAGRLTLLAQLYGRTAFFNGLLTGEDPEALVAERLAQYGVDTGGDHCCLVLRTERDEPPALEGPSGDRVTARAASNEDITVWLAEKEPGWAWNNGRDIVMLVPAGQGLRTKDGQTRFAERLVRDAEGRFAFLRVKAGVAATTDAGEGPWDLRSLYRQAVDALLVGGAEAARSVVHHADIGLFRVAFQMLKDKNCLALAERTIGGLAAYDRGHGNNLLATLERILEDGNLKATAQRLYIHHNTALWRKRRIEKILGMSLDSFETRVLVSLYLKVWRLAGLN